MTGRNNSGTNPSMPWLCNIPVSSLCCPSCFAWLSKVLAREKFSLSCLSPYFLEVNFSAESLRFYERHSPRLLDIFLTAGGDGFREIAILKH